MKRYRRLFRLMMALLVLSTLETPAWAGGAGFLWFAAALGLYTISGGPYGWYDPYYAYPYYSAYRYPASYSDENVPENTGYASPAYEMPAAPSPRNQPVSSENMRPSLPNISPLPGEPLPANSVPRFDLGRVKEKLAAVRALLDKKAAAGYITKVQRDSEAVYLTQIERVAQAETSAQKGLLSSDQQEALLKEILHINTLVSQNFVTQ